MASRPLAPTLVHVGPVAWVGLAAPLVRRIRRLGTDDPDLCSALFHADREGWTFFVGLWRLGEALGGKRVSDDSFSACREKLPESDVTRNRLKINGGVQPAGEDKYPFVRGALAITAFLASE